VIDQPGIFFARLYGGNKSMDREKKRNEDSNDIFNRKDRKGNESKSSLTKIGELIYLSGKDFLIDNGPQWAAAIAYYSLLSLFPLLLAITSIGSYFVNLEWIIEQVTGLMEGLIPEGTQEIEDVIREAYDARGGVGILSTLALLWSGSRVFGVVTRALNIAFDSDDRYGVVRRTLAEILMLLTLGLLLIIALVSQFLLAYLISLTNIFPENQNLLFQIAIDAIPLVLLFFFFLLLYRYLPNRSVEWSAAFIGAVVALLLFFLARPLFQNYVQQFANYNLIYGSLAIVIIIIFWAWLMGLIVLFGGEIASHYEALFVQGLLKEEVEEKHRQRSPISSRRELNVDS
jgi:membrane protein